jgi:hypothetical protein
LWMANPQGEFCILVTKNFFNNYSLVTENLPCGRPIAGLPSGRRVDMTRRD